MHIDLAALRHSYRLARGVHGDRALAVAKANTYGHGTLASSADGFAVDFLEEALALRSGGICAPLLLPEGLFEPAELAVAQAHPLWLVVHQEEQAAHD